MGGRNTEAMETERTGVVTVKSRIWEAWIISEVSYLEQGREEQTPSTLLLPSAALHTAPLASGDLIMEDSPAMRTEPVCVWDGLKRGTSPMCRTKGWDSRRLGEIVKEGRAEAREKPEAVECGARVDNITGRKVWADCYYCCRWLGGCFQQIYVLL